MLPRALHHHVSRDCCPRGGGWEAAPPRREEEENSTTRRRGRKATSPKTGRRQATPPPDRQIVGSLSICRFAHLILASDLGRQAHKSTQTHNFATFLKFIKCQNIKVNFDFVRVNTTNERTGLSTETTRRRVRRTTTHQQAQHELARLDHLNGSRISVGNLDDHVTPRLFGCEAGCTRTLGTSSRPAVRQAVVARCEFQSVAARSRQCVYPSETSTCRSVSTPRRSWVNSITFSCRASCAALTTGMRCLALAS